jgi:hypothetical protein
MITFSKFDSATINALGKRIIKIFSISGAKTASDCVPFGIDTNPIKGMTAIHATTSNDSESVVIGYIDNNKLAQSGEIRLYSKDAQGVEKTFLWLKNNGTLEMNGNQYTTVRFEPLKTGLDNSVNLLNIELTKIQTAIQTLGGAYPRADVAINIDNAKSETVKLK